MTTNNLNMQLPMLPSAKKQYPELPSAKDFCLSVPLYEQFLFDNQKGNPFSALEYFDGTLDFHCPECGRHSVFMAKKNDYQKQAAYFFNYIFYLHFQCSRDKSHKACFIFRAHDGVLQKIGQIPSLADLALPDLHKYKKILGNDRFRELSRAIGLTAHGVGVGAFVYLRRIFESLIDDAHTVASTDQGWDEEAYIRAHMDEKVGLLRNHLPVFLVENRSLYSILSVGVHTLSEEKCLSAFPIVRLGIELILDDQLEKHEREKKIRHAKNSIASLGGSLKNAAATEPKRDLSNV